MQNPGLAKRLTVGLLQQLLAKSGISPTLAGKRPMPWNLPSGIMKAQGGVEGRQVASRRVT